MPRIAAHSSTHFLMWGLEIPWWDPTRGSDSGLWRAACSVCILPQNLWSCPSCSGTAGASQDSYTMIASHYWSLLDQEVVPVFHLKGHLKYRISTPASKDQGEMFDKWYSRLSFTDVSSEIEFRVSNNTLPWVGSADSSVVHPQWVEQRHFTFTSGALPSPASSSLQSSTAARW